MRGADARFARSVGFAAWVWLPTESNDPWGGELAAAALAWVDRRNRQRATDVHSRLIQVKETAYALRQAVFFLSFLSTDRQVSVVDALQAAASGLPDSRLVQVAQGLRRCVDGESFDADGRMTGGARRLLGWAYGPHWALGRAGASRA